MNSDSQIYIIAEIAQAHDGSLGIAHSFIDALKNCGVNAVKFQVHLAEAESSQFETFRVPFSYEDKTRYDYWKRMEFTVEQWKGLKKHCEDCGMEFMASPFSIAAVDLLESLGVKRYKIGSGEISNLLLLNRISATGKEVILSSGLSSYVELAVATDHLRKTNSHFSILQCTTSYPTQPEEWGLSVMTELGKRFHCMIGFSDHSGDIFACLAAAALGARILEFHAVFDKRMFGPDASSSLTIDEISTLVKGVRQLERSLNTPVDKDQIDLKKDLKVMFGKSLAVNKDLRKGHVLTLKDLESKKPAQMGIAAAEYNSVLGKTIVNDIAQYSFLQLKDLKD